MNSKKQTFTAFHLTSKQKFHVGQKISINTDKTNVLYDFFLRKEVKSPEGKDIFEILGSNQTNSSLTLDVENTKLLKKYNDITLRGMREVITEMVRLQEFSHLPSRLHCLYAAKTYEEILEWKKIFDSYDRKYHQIVKLEVLGNFFEGDGELLPNINGDSLEKKIIQARTYWSGEKRSNLIEMLITGEIEVSEIVHEY
ncbi:DUF2441 domain-containing protein [Patescibacteria group bacterium]|nr:DUF2441 domain-containing protein [Patescibacteria group bacterium]